jgi:hypothetical protein
MRVTAYEAIPFQECLAGSNIAEPAFFPEAPLARPQQRRGSTLLPQYGALKHSVLFTDEGPALQDARRNGCRRIRGAVNPHDPFIIRIVEGFDTNDA